MKREEKSQLNIKIDPKLLLRLKSREIKNGKTLTAFITEILEQSPTKITSDIDILEQRLLRVEEQIKLKDNLSPDKEKDLNPSKSIFTNSGAKRYGEIAKKLFDLHREKRHLSLKDAFAELSTCLANFDST